jgi:hypothetical protein
VIDSFRLIKLRDNKILFVWCADYAALTHQIEGVFDMCWHRHKWLYSITSIYLDIHRCQCRKLMSMYVSTLTRVYSITSTEVCFLLTIFGGSLSALCAVYFPSITKFDISFKNKRNPSALVTSWDMKMKSKCISSNFNRSRNIK